MKLRSVWSPILRKTPSRTNVTRVDNADYDRAGLVGREVASLEDPSGVCEGRCVSTREVPSIPSGRFMVEGPSSAQETERSLRRSRPSGPARDTGIRGIDIEMGGFSQARVE